MYSMENILFTYKILFKCSNGLQNELIFLFLNHSLVSACDGVVANSVIRLHKTDQKKCKCVFPILWKFYNKKEMLTQNIQFQIETFNAYFQ